MKKRLFCLQCALLCLLLVACDGFRGGRQTEPAAEGGETLSTRASPAQTPAAPATATVAATETPETLSTATVAGEGVPVAVASTETPAAPGESAVHAQGTGATLALPACYDFDGGASVVPPDAACDFSMLPGPDGGTIEVYPQAGAQLAYGGVFPEPPAPAQCAASDAFSGESEIVAPLAAMYVCYRSGEGRVGYLHFTDADLEQAGTVTFDWLTFSGEEGGEAGAGAPGSVYFNDTFGFRLALPATWAGYQVTERVHAEAERPDAGTVCFTFGERQPLCVLKIDVWTRDGWRALEMVPDGYYLAENGGYVFAAGPYEPACVQLDEFQCERRQEVPTILAGFRVE